MNKRIQKLAEKAGFIFWKDEEWKPSGELIDWSCLYDNELVKFAELIRADERKKFIPPPKECQTEEEKTAYAWGWWKAIESMKKKDKRL